MPSSAARLLRARFAAGSSDDAAAAAAGGAGATRLPSEEMRVVLQ